MNLKTVKHIKLELKRLRKRQNTHKDDDKLTRKKNKLRSKLRQLLKEEASTRKLPRPRGRAVREETAHSGKTKGSDRYI